MTTVADEPVLRENPQEFRDYGAAEDHVTRHYRMMRENQTVSYVLAMKEHFSKFNNGEMTVWEAFDILADLIDASDPDTTLPNIVHMFQTAEAIRAMGEPDWMQLTGLIHDLGKLIYRFGGGAAAGQDGSGGDQWGMVGDTFVVGCPLPDSLVLSKFNTLNPDMKNPAYTSSPIGMYSPHCGLHNTHVAFGHDEYLYMVLKNHPGCSLPQDALDIIRFHSMYCWHQGGAYRDLMIPEDEKMLDVVKRFQKFDLYTKHNDRPDIDALKPYYQSLIDKYIPGKLKW